MTTTRRTDSAAMAGLREAAGRAHAGIVAGAIGAESAHAAVDEMLGAGEELEAAAERASRLMDDMTGWVMEA